MKRILVVVSVIASSALLAETAEEAYARLSSYRGVWETNATAYAKLAAIGDDPAVAEAKTRWFLDVMAFPDVTETNRLDDVLYAKRQILQKNAGSRCISGNTNCWYAVADFIARLKDAADPGWQDVESESFSSAVRNYRQECLEAYVRQHTNFVAGVDPTNSFYRGWRSMYIDKWNREAKLEKAQDKAKQIIMKSFWRFGARDLPADVMAVCRSNIVERAHLTTEEERDIFEDVPYWYNRVMGTKKKKAAK